MERKKAHYLRDIICEEELMKYASKAGVQITLKRNASSATAERLFHF